MRADADATERSGGIDGNDTSALCAQSTCMVLVGDNTGVAFSALIAFLLMIALRRQYSGSEGGINPLGNGIDTMPLRPLGSSFEGIAGQETFTGDMAELYQGIERHHHVIDTPRRNLV
jgi:hypothetical protein